MKLEPNYNFPNEGSAEFIPSDLLKKVLEKPEPEAKTTDKEFEKEFSIAFNADRVKPLDILKGGEILLNDN